jgi:ribonucleotide reductase alpha subunit
MFVVKRNGQKEAVAFEKVQDRVAKAASGLSVCAVKVAQGVLTRIIDGITTTELDNIAANLAYAWSTSHPDYATLAARIAISSHQRNTPATMLEAVEALDAVVDRTGERASILDPEFVEVVRAHAAEIEARIDYERDYLLDYFGFKTLEKAYLLRDSARRVVERPQHLWMRVAIGIWMHDLPRAFEMYDMISRKQYTHATPTLFNAGTKRPQLSSCYLLQMNSDSIVGIYKTLQDCALISQYGGGIGVHTSNIRAKGSMIRGTGGTSNGIVPMLRVFNNTARYVDQGGGKRNGSFAMYLEPWHADVLDFLELKKNTGSEEERARDLFYGLWIPDLFMERVDANGDWTLFCPNEAPGLADAVGADFKALYERYEAEGRGKKTVKAQYLWFRILDSQIETGTPYLLYKDAANKKSNQQNLGTIKSSNLCVAPDTKILIRRDGAKVGDATADISGVVGKISAEVFGGEAVEVEIASVAGQEVEVWNGSRWSKTTVLKTGENQPVIGVDIVVGTIDGNSGQTYARMHHIECTPYHKFIVKGDDDSLGIAKAPRVDAKDLKRGMSLVDWCDADGEIHEALVWDIADYGRVCDTYCFNEPENHAGIFNGVLTGNCTEIIEYSDEKETAVCNLASLSLPAFVHDGAFDFAEFRRVVGAATKNLNRVIDVSYYPIPEAKVSNMRHRPIGLGVQGLADVFAMLGLAWESAEAATLNRRIFAHMYYAACEASCDLAASEGVYDTWHGSPAQKGKLQFDLWGAEPESDAGLDWDGLANSIRRIGMRNSLLVAPMPTASTSQILGNCECIEPYSTHIFTRRTLAGEFIIVNRHLVKVLMDRGLWSDQLKDRIIANNGSVQGLAEVPEDVQTIFKTVWEIKQKTLIDMAADRGPYICQSQSLNLFLGDADYRKLTSMHFYAWRKGLKTGIYYLRTRAAAAAQKFTVDPSTTAAAPPKATPQEPAECLMCSS